MNENSLNTGPIEKQMTPVYSEGFVTSYKMVYIIINAVNLKIVILLEVAYSGHPGVPCTIAFWA